MATAKLINHQGAEVGNLDLNAAVFELEQNPVLVKTVAVALLAAQRQGNHETKTRGEVSGGGKKPYRQKGTGNARHGSSREPQMRGGGTVFGPHKRSYRQDVPVSFRRKALGCMLSDRLREQALCVLDKFAGDESKTKTFADFYGTVAPNGERTLIVTAAHNQAVLRSARNLPRVTVRTAADVNALDILSARQVVVEQDAIAVLEARVAKRREKATS